MIHLKKIFKKKIVLIFSLIILFIIALFAIFYMILFSFFKINGNKVVNINYKEEYIDEGASFKIFNKDLSEKIVVKSNIDYKKIGKYKITYSVKYLFFNIKKERIVNVFDMNKPKINLNGETKVNICPDDRYEEQGYEAIDDYDGDITDNVKISITKEGNIIYEVSDNSGNKSIAIRKIIKEDKVSPVLVLKGSTTSYVKVNSNYKDFGYEVTDNCDSNINVKQETNLDTTKEGKYKLTYIATDSSGNTSSVTREIIVYKEYGNGIIYLTFDDGPSGIGSTSKILNILAEEGIKATFFVTGYGDLSLIRREYLEGHKVALHTDTHNYSYVYSSIDNYFNDLISIQNKVYDLIGIRPNIIRFPGGSNNTVSNRYNSGIMNILTKEVLDRGFIYFDWNVSAGDAGGCNTSDCVYNNTINGLSKSKINIVLMHDNKMITANALKDIIEYGKNNGYIFKVIDEETSPIRFK